MRLVYSVLIVTMMGVLAGCGKDAYSNRAQGTDFGAYKTYAWLPMQKDTTDGNVLQNEITYVNLREAANKEMQRRGYMLNTENPDILLSLRTNFQEEREIVRNYAYSGFYPGYYYANPYSPYWGGFYGGFYSFPYSYDYVYDYIKGTVIVDVIDRNKKQLVWRGWTDEMITDEDDVQDLYKEVEDIFDEYPVKENKKVKK